MTTTTDDKKTDTDTGPPPGQQHADGDTGPTMGDLRKVVAEVVEAAVKPLRDLVPGGGSSPSSPSSPPAPAAAAGQPGDLSAMVDAAVSKVTGQRDQAAAAEAHRKQHEAIAAAAERQPVDRPRRSKWLGDIWDR